MFSNHGEVSTPSAVVLQEDNYNEWKNFIISLIPTRFYTLGECISKGVIPAILDAYQPTQDDYKVDDTGLKGADLTTAKLRQERIVESRAFHDWTRYQEELKLQEREKVAAMSLIMLNISPAIATRIMNREEYEDVKTRTDLIKLMELIDSVMEATSSLDREEKHYLAYKKIMALRQVPGDFEEYVAEFKKIKASIRHSNDLWHEKIYMHAFLDGIYAPDFGTFYSNYRDQKHETPTLAVTIKRFQDKFAQLKQTNPVNVFKTTESERYVEPKKASKTETKTETQSHMQGKGPRKDAKYCVYCHMDNHDILACKRLQRDLKRKSHQKVNNLEFDD